MALTDQRRRHSNRPQKLGVETKTKFTNFLKSGRKSDYSLSDTSKIYLPENFNISELHKMYLENNSEYPLS